jgi:hypothetical protein
MNTDDISLYSSARIVSFPILVLLFALVLDMGSFETREPATVIVGESISVNEPGPPVKGDLYVYLENIARRESSGRARVVNRYGYLGKYQFSPKTLWSLGREFKVTRDEFLGNVALQDRAMVEYLRDNREMLEEIIVRYDGQWYNGIYVTESGILAGAHLVGPQGLMAFFDTDYTICSRTRCRRPRTVDGNGTHVGEYVEKFSGYTLGL